MKSLPGLGPLIILALAATAHPAVAATKNSSAAILADPARPAGDVEQDRNRAPLETMAFAGVKKGQVIADYLANGGYYTRLLASAVGPKGRIYSVQLDNVIKLDSIRPAYTALAAWAESKPQVTIQVEPARTKLSFPRKLDIFWLTQNYHDLHDDWLGPYDVAAFNRQVFEALKVGGAYLIVDHNAVDGAADDVTERLHRVAAARVRREVERAGFCFAGESDVLRNPADPRTAAIGDPTVRGRTDRFTFKFRRPAKAGRC